MTAYPPIVSQLYDAGRIVLRDLLRFDFEDIGSHGFSSSAFNLEWAGLTYYPGGVLKVVYGDKQTGQAALPFTVTLALSRDFATAPDILSTILSYKYQGAFVTGYRAWLDEATGAIVHVKGLFEGRISSMPRRSGADGQTLVANCETDQIDAHQNNYRLYSGADQKLINPADTFMDNMEDGATEQLWFGRTGPRT